MMKKKDVKKLIEKEVRKATMNIESAAERDHSAEGRLNPVDHFSDTAIPEMARTNTEPAHPLFDGRAGA